MPSWGKCDFGELKKLQRRLQDLEKVDLDKFCMDASRELAARLLALVIPRTPVGVYPKGSGKTGGTLRRAWTGSAKGGAKAYVKSLSVHKSGNIYKIEIKNPTEYASYVEFGHRTPGGNGWVEGQYFLTISEEKLKQITPSVLERKLDKYLKEVFGGGSN